MFKNPQIPQASSFQIKSEITSGITSMILMEFDVRRFL